MSKYHGKIGFAITEQTTPGVYTRNIVEREYFGDIYRNVVRVQPTSQINPDINQNIELSVIADQFLLERIGYIAYVEYRGIKWMASSGDFTTYPRVTIQLGGVYNG